MAEASAVAENEKAPIADWVFHSVVSFLRSPLWICPIEDFVDKHCHKFKPRKGFEMNENAHEWTVLHQQFRDLVEELLVGFLQELDVDVEQFVIAIKSDVNEELSKLITEYICALDDFECFRSMMQSKLQELELIAMCQFAQMAAFARQMGQMQQQQQESPQRQQQSSGDTVMIGSPVGVLVVRGGGVSNNEEDEERRMFDLAVQSSIDSLQIAEKEAEAMDAQLLQALALTVALEQERLVLLALKTELEGMVEKQEKLERLERETQETIAKATEETERKRVENVEKLEQEKEAIKVEQQQQMTSPTKAAAQKASTTTENLNTASAVSLAPLGQRRGEGFGAKPVLPGISGGRMPSVTVPQAQAQPSFEEIKAAQKQQKQQQQPHSPNQPSEDEMRQREQYLKEQREKLKQLREQKRAHELEQAKAKVHDQSQPIGQEAPKQTPTIDPKHQGNFSGLSAEEQKELRLQFARRHKEEILATMAAQQQQQNQ